MELDRRRRHTWEPVSERDHISGLQDELLHDILCRLGSAAAAARTSVLSRRWRHVWTSLPELVLGEDLTREGPSFLDAVDDALASYSASHVHRLEIAVPRNAPAPRVASWLGFASRRLAGVLRLRMHFPEDPDRHREVIEQWKPRDDSGDGDELELPSCEGATSIELWLLRLGAPILLRLPQPASTLAALADLQITEATVEGRALEALVSTQCPRLRKLSLCSLTLVAASDISLRSGTLNHLKFDVQDTLRLYVSAPALQVLEVESNTDDVYVAAPSLAEIVWGIKCAHFVFADAGSHLRRLAVNRHDAMAPLMRRFRSVEELRLGLFCLIAGAGDGFKSTNYNLLKCQTLCVSMVENGHAFALTVLHLLRTGNGIRKLDVSYTSMYPSELCSSTRFRLPESSVIDNIMLDSLEEIEIDLCGASANKLVEFLKQLLFNIWSNTRLKSVETNILHPDPSLINEICEKIHATCPSNIRIVSNVFPGRKVRARFETSPL